MDKDRVSPDATDDDALLRAFPAEDQWLDPPYPPVPHGFVDATLRRIRADAAAGDAALSALLSAFAVPEPGADARERMLGQVRAGPAAQWQRLLQGHAVPAPPSDFVERVLRALRRDEPGETPETAAAAVASPRPVLRSWRARTWGLPLAAAAALVLGLMLSRSEGGRGPHHLPILTTPAHHFSPDRYAAALSRLHDRGLGVVVEDDLVTFASRTRIHRQD